MPCRAPCPVSRSTDTCACPPDEPRVRRPTAEPCPPASGSTAARPGRADRRPPASPSSSCLPLYGSVRRTEIVSTRRCKHYINALFHASGTVLLFLVHPYYISNPHLIDVLSALSPLPYVIKAASDCISAVVNVIYLGKRLYGQTLKTM